MIPLKVALVQSVLHWEQPEANRNAFEQTLYTINRDTEIVVLPEMFSTGFSMNTNLAETMEGATIQWMQQMAKKYSFCIAGSLMIKENGTFFNRFVWVFPDGTLTYYNKRHLFSLAKENEHFSAGAYQKIVEYKGWKIALAVCYDLRFPAWLRRTSTFDYDALIIVANWPEKRIAHWNILLQARAIENQSYVLGVNRIGFDGNDFQYTGSSMVVSPQGSWLNECGNTEKVIYSTLDYSELSTWRKVFPAANDADSFTLA